MKWDYNQPKSGDAVRVKLGQIYHYGIFVSNEEIVQFGLAPNLNTHLKNQDIAVCTSDMDTFLQGGFLERGLAEKCDGKKRSNKAVVKFAKSKLGQTGYNIIHNNCEHFVYECLFGVKKCSQTDQVRQMFLAIPICHVYTAKIPQDVQIGQLSCQLRNEEIANVSHKDVKAEKYYVWKLLEYALYKTFGYKASEMTFDKCNGKWTTPSCCFSLSHSNGVVACAVSRMKVGVDVEIVDGSHQKTITRVLNSQEKALIDGLCDYHLDKALITIWSQKESIFKTQNSNKFAPAKIQTVGQSVATITLDVDGKEYVLSTATPFVEKIRYFHNVDLQN